MFRTPQTGWSAPAPGPTFEETVWLAIADRKKNPRHNLPTAYDVVANELEQFTVARLNGDPNYCVDDALQSSFHLPPAPLASGLGARSVAAVSKYAKNVSAGIGLYAEWFGTGMPVDQAEAERRASICAVCPKMEKGNIAQRFNELAAKQIMQVFQILHDLNLKTSHDDALHICDPCDCPMKAKVWSPLEIINRHIRPESRAELWEKCWITQ